MIPVSQKFPLRTELLGFQKRARQLSSPHLRLLFIAHSPSRLAVIIPKKAGRLSTTRNSLKRLVYDQLFPLINKQNLDVVVIFKPLAPPGKPILLSELTSLTQQL